MTGLLVLPHAQGGEKIRVLLTGQILDRGSQIPQFLGSEPLVDMVAVPARGDYVVGGRKTLIKYIRQYFPRTEEDMRTFDYIMFISPEYQLFTTQQDKWMHDVIQDGAGGFNDASVFSVVAEIHAAWAASLTQLAFPNDAPAVVARGGGGSAGAPFFVRVNKDFPDPVLTAYLPFGIEQVPCSRSRFVIPREGAGVLAWQVGNFPGRDDVPYLVVWDYGEGRTMTIGDAMHKDLGFFRYPKTARDSLYAPDILTNIILYSTGRNLIEDVGIFHGLKSYFLDFRSRLAVLVSLGDFIDRLGANTQPINEMIWELEDIAEEGSELYLDQRFVDAEARMSEAIQGFVEVDELAKRLKTAALIWVYAIEWLVTTATFLVSGIALWSLMARRKLYRAVDTTKFS
jgi:hypothetical protein